MKRYLLALPILLLYSFCFSAEVPTYYDSPKYKGSIKYFYNEYTRQKDAMSGGGHWEIVFSTTIGTETQSVVVSGLDGNRDIMYRIDTWAGFNSAGSDGVIFFNGDGGTNYGINRIYSNGATTTPHQNSTQSGISWMYTNTSFAKYTGELYAKADGTAVHYRSITYSGGGFNTYYQTGVGVWRNVTDNITSITFYCLNANILAGSYFAIWALR